MIRKILTISVVMAIILTVIGCGGGSDSKDKGKSITTLSGIAVDELILNGKVKITKPDNTFLVEGRTSSDKGTYTLDIENYTGPIVINVTCDTDSKLLIGTRQETCPIDLNLNSVANTEGKAVVVNISPLSDTVYQIAKKAGISKVSIDKAINQISTVFGINPILNDPTTGAYADIIEAFHKAANNTVGKDVFDVIDDFVDDISDGVIDNSVTLGNALQNANVTTTVPATGEDLYTVPENPALSDDKVQVKAFIQDLRTQGTTMESYANNEAEAMGTALKSVALDVQTVSDYVVRIIDLVVQAREDGNSTFGAQIGIGVTQSTTNPNEWTYSTRRGDYTGTISIPEITEGMEYTFTSLNASFRGTLPYVDVGYRQKPNVQTQTVALDIALVKSGDVMSVTLSDLSIENGGNKIVIDSLRGRVSYSAPSNSNENPVFNYVKLDTMTLTAVTGDYKATGTLSVPEYVVNTSLEARGGIEETSTTNAYISIYCTASQIENVSAILNIGGLEYIYNQDLLDSNYAYLSIDNIYGDYTGVEIENASIITATCSDNSAPQNNIGVWNNSDKLIGNSGHISKKISFEGSLKNIKTNGEISGNIDVELVNAITINLVDNDNVGDDILLKVDVGGKLLMPNRPKTLVNIGYETRADNATKHSVTGSYSHDTTLLTVAGALDKAGNNGQLTFTNGTGIQAQFILNNDTFINGDAVSSTGSLVTKDGKVIATIESRNDNIIIIKYLDGSLETIF